MSRIAWTYIAAVLVAAVALAASAQFGNAHGAVDLIALGVFATLAIVGQFLEVQYGRDSYYPHLMPFFAALILMPPYAFILVVAIPHIVEAIKRQLVGNPYAWYIQPYNIATHVIAGLVAHWLFTSLGGRLDEFTLQSTLLAVGPALLVYAIINHFLIGQILVVARGISWSESRVLTLDSLATDIAMMSLGYVAALLWLMNPGLLLLILAPFLLFQRALRVPELEKQSQRDAKTGLWNARYFNTHLEEHLAQAKLVNRPLTVIMADLDLLRTINNTYGHLAGDAVIAGIGQIILQIVRKDDIACRFGGEEYAILLPNVDVATAKAIAERIRHTVEMTAFEVATIPNPIYVTMSLGIASYPRDGSTITELLHEADIALYQAKMQGRNRVVNSSEVPHSARLRFEHANEQTAGGDAAPAPAAGQPLAGSVTPETTPATLPATSPTAGEAPAPPAAPAQPETAPATPPERQAAPAYLWLFVYGVITVGLLATLVAIGFDPHLQPLPLLLFAGLALGTQWLEIELYEKSTVSISMAVVLAAAVVCGPLGIVATSTAIVVVHTWRKRPKVYKMLFNWTTHLLAGLAPWATVHLLEHNLANNSSTETLLWWIAPALAGSLLYYIIETGLIATAIALSERLSIYAVWREQFRWLTQHYLVMGVLGFFLAIAYRQMGPVGILVFSLPILIMHLTQKAYVARTEGSVRELRRMNRELSNANREIADAKESIENLNEELFLTLAKIIDARDPYVSGHASQVGEYAQAIAIEMGLDAKRIEECYQAGLLHDIGKIGIPEKILHKPARLTDIEYEIVKRHALLGATFLQSCHGLRHLAPLVHHHHERWDGAGYPHGLKHEEIPLGARILAVCDSVEAMASDRPYQSAKPLDEIIEELDAGAGAQFDPQVVQAFIRVVEKNPNIVINSALKVSKNHLALQANRGGPLVDHWHPGWAY